MCIELKGGTHERGRSALAFDAPPGLERRHARALGYNTVGWSHPPYIFVGILFFFSESC